MDKKMMICPNKECARYKRKPKRYYHCDKHSETKTCTWHNRIDSKKNTCPACIPYVEPSPAKEALTNEMRNDKEFMAGVKKGLQDVRDGKVRAWGDIKKELNIAPSPEPSMPLLYNDVVRRRIEDIFTLILETGKWCDGDINAILVTVSEWLPAHDLAVRKALIVGLYLQGKYVAVEEVCKLLDDELRIISPNTEAKLKAHLRAMAGER